MVERQQLHALIESLPEGALEAAQTYLTAIQTWPPKPPEYPPDVVQRRKELEAKRDRFLKYPASGTWVIDKNNKSHASFGTSEHNWDTGDYTVKTFRVHYDFPVEITERFCMKDEQTLEYDFHVSGLGKEHAILLQFRANSVK
ncbi:MAG TPA: hypothetical protein VD837_04785 [Terriglobales bacterium]|nr:hypothetical protein [Terriglobales bacterium]